MVPSCAAFYYALSLLKVPLMGKVSWTAPQWLTLLLIVASSHILYAFVWYKTPAFKKLCKGVLGKVLMNKKPVKVFGKLVLLFKAVQQLALLVWAFSLVLGLTTVGAAIGFVLNTSTVQKAVAVVLIAVGQGLNVAIYKAIGTNGVYYGFKLGAPVPWSTAFPFSAGYRHPQYVGGYITQLGVLLLLASPKTIEAGLVPLAAWWAICYTATSIVEASGDNDN